MDQILCKVTKSHAETDHMTKTSIISKMNTGEAPDLRFRVSHKKLKNTANNITFDTEKWPSDVNLAGIL